MRVHLCKHSSLPFWGCWGYFEWRCAVLCCVHATNAARPFPVQNKLTHAQKKITHTHSCGDDDDTNVESVAALKVRWYKVDAASRLQ